MHDARRRLAKMCGTARAIARGRLKTCLGSALIWAAVVGPATPAAELVVRTEADRLIVTEAGGAAVGSFVFADPAVGRPALRDVHAPGGALITRPCPPRPGIDPDDHAAMHPGVMLCFSDLSGADPWRRKTAVRVGACRGEAADGTVTITCDSDYLDTPADRPDAGVVCHERSRIALADRVLAGQPVRVVTWKGELSAPRDAVVFGDVEEMGLGIRLVRELSPAGGGRYLADHAGRDEKGIFGRPARWCDASGTVGGGRVGALVIAGPGGGQPPRWHARDYGWLLANPFGSRAYGAAEPGGARLARGETLVLRHTLVLHGDVPDADLDRLAAGAGAVR